MKHNNVIVDEHFRKKWHDINKLRTNVRTWFTQPARHKRRKDARNAKAAKVRTSERGQDREEGVGSKCVLMDHALKMP